MNRTEWAVLLIAVGVVLCVGYFILMLLESILTVASLLV